MLASDHRRLLSFSRLYSELLSHAANIILLEKWFPLRGEQAHSLKLFCMYDKRFEISKQKRMEEETEPQT